MNFGLGQRHLVVGRGLAIAKLILHFHGLLGAHLLLDKLFDQLLLAFGRAHHLTQLVSVNARVLISVDIDLVLIAHLGVVAGHLLAVTIVLTGHEAIMVHAFVSRDLRRELTSALVLGVHAGGRHFRLSIGRFIVEQGDDLLLTQEDLHDALTFLLIQQQIRAILIVGVARTQVRRRIDMIERRDVELGRLLALSVLGLGVFGKLPLLLLVDLVNSLLEIVLELGLRRELTFELGPGCLVLTSDVVNHLLQLINDTLVAQNLGLLVLEDLAGRLRLRHVQIRQCRVVVTARRLR